MYNVKSASFICYRIQNTQSENKPTLKINNNGICSACEYQEIKDNKIDWELRENELKKLCDNYRSPMVVMIVLSLVVEVKTVVLQPTY